MKTKVLYTIINLLSLASAAALGWLIIVVIAGLAASKTIKWHEFNNLFSSIFGLLVLTIVLYAIWDIGTRLIRMEQAQESLLREMRSKQSSVA